MLLTKYIAKNKNLIMNGIKDYPITGVETEKILKNLIQTMFREDSHFANWIGQGDLLIHMVKGIDQY